MICKNLESLSDYIRDKARDALIAMNADMELKGLGVVSVVINESRRDLTTQMAYFSRGRMPAVEDVRAMYRAAGLGSITAGEAKRAITWTLDSKHLRGEAVDFVPVRSGVAWWGAPSAVWDRMGVIGESCGLKWGGRWKTRDCPHFEI